MMELEYIPLKTAEGVACGHAKVRSGTVEISLRAGWAGEAVVLTDGGSFTGSPGVRIHTAGRVQAVAVREGGALRCCGVARRSAYTVAEVRLRLSAQAPQKPKPVSPPERMRRDEPARERPRIEEKRAMEPHRAEAPAPLPEQSGGKATLPEAPPQKSDLPEAAEGLMEDGLPFHPDTAIKQALSRLAEETAAAFWEEVPLEPAAQERILAAPDPAPACADDGAAAHTLDDTVADTEAFSALMARADAVFAKIDAPVDDKDPGNIAGEEPVWKDPAWRDPGWKEPVWKDPGWRDPVWRDQAERNQAGMDTEDWCGAVDRLLHAGHAGAGEPGRIPVQNPFPHIFPGARFYKETGDGAGALRGDWMSGRERMTITAVRGDYSPKPPEDLPGFTRYIRAKSGGYWVKVSDAER